MSALLTVNDVKGFLDEAEAIGDVPTEIGFTGGEPFVNPNMCGMLEHVLERRYRPGPHKCDAPFAEKKSSVAA